MFIEFLDFKYFQLDKQRDDTQQQFAGLSYA